MHKCWGDKGQYSDKHYQTVVSNHVIKMALRKRAIDASFGSDRKDLYV